MLHCKHGHSAVIENLLLGFTTLTSFTSVGRKFSPFPTDRLVCLISRVHMSMSAGRLEQQTAAPQSKQTTESTTTTTTAAMTTSHTAHTAANTTTEQLIADIEATPGLAVA